MHLKRFDTAVHCTVSLDSKHISFLSIGTGKTVVAGDAEYFQALYEKEPNVVDTDLLYE